MRLLSAALSTAALTFTPRPVSVTARARMSESSVFVGVCQVAQLATAKIKAKQRKPSP
ncbi:hypothetical protein [Caballeronia calidae]|uniref:hypothetical protein n=1 Tax=Caballeronia calidae TaxID=1777139 RepID=UPI001E354190|nr:hypothetical protein [Caballeronia calidae]